MNVPRHRFLLAAGNKYNMKLILEAIRIQYPPGMSVTGIPNKFNGRRTAPHNQKHQRGGKLVRDRQAWHVEAEAEDQYDERWDDYGYEAYVTEAPPEDAAAGDSNNQEYDDVVYDEEAVENDTEHAADGGEAEMPDLTAVVEALTVTSRRLAEITKSRGFYQDKSKGKASGKATSSKGKSKGKMSEKGKHFKGKGKGKPGPMPTKGNFAMQRKAIEESLCLGCGKPGHWLRDCPNVGTYQAQLTTVGTTLDVDGMVDHSSSWVVTSTPALSSCCESEEKGVTVDVAIPEENILSESIAVFESVAASGSFAVFEPIAVSQNDAVFVEPHVHDNIAVSKFSQAFEIDMLPVEIETSEPNAVVKNPHVHEFDMFVAENYMVTPHAVHEHDKPYVLYDNPQILLQSMNDVEGGMMIADTGCQRQVAGSRWHEIRQRSIQPLTPVKFHDSCSFSSGPHKGTPAEARYAYPAGLGGSMVALGVSLVSCDAPALFSRPAFEILGAVPDIGKGVMFYRALNKTSKLFLASGHLAIRIDEWPDEVFDWPLSFSEQSMPDVFIPDAVPLKINKLDVACEPARRPPHAAVAQHSAMAAQLEVPDGELPRAPVRRADHGAQLCGNVDEAKDQRLHLGQLLPSADGGDQKTSTAVYQNDPNTCGHPSGLRTYGAAGYRVHICDLCGNRWRESKDKDKSLILCAPKASPTAKTPLGLKIGEPYFPKKPQGAMALAEGPRASSSEPWGSSSAGARRSQSRSLSAQTSKAKAKPSVRLTAQALAAQQVAEMDDVSMGSWDLQERPQQPPAPSISYAPSIRSSRVMPGRRPLAKMEPQLEEELTLGTSGEHVWRARPAHYSLDEENYEEELEEEEIEHEFYDEGKELHQPLDG